MAVSLLRYANREKVAQALTEQGYSVTRMTVNRWARGAEMPEIAARMIAELFSHADTKEAAPPQWAGRLMRTVDAIAEKVGVSRDDEQAAILDGVDSELPQRSDAETSADRLGDGLTGAGHDGGHGR
jgi:hypothetical protein